MTESPTLEEPKVEEPVAETVVETGDAEALAAKLTELGIDNIDKIEGTVKAGQEAGRLANMLGEERAARQALEAQLRETQTQRTSLDNDEYGVDLGAVVEKGIEKFWNRQQQQAAQMQQRQMQEFQKIRSHKNYALVGKDFEEYAKTPDYQNELMSGKTPSEIFYDMSNDKLREYLVTMKNAIETKTKAPANIPVPHTESGQGSPPGMEDVDEKSDKLKSIKKNWKGDDNDMRSVLDVLLPSGTLP